MHCGSNGASVKRSTQSTVLAKFDMARILIHMLKEDTDFSMHVEKIFNLNLRREDGGRGRSGYLLDEE